MHLKCLGLMAAVAAALMAFAAPASATSVSTTTGGAAATPTIHAVNEGGHVVVANSIANIECSSTFEGKVESHGAGKEASGNFSSFSLTGCTNSWHVTITFKGGWAFSWSSGEVGVYRIFGLEITTTRFGVTCNYSAPNTIVGTATGGNPATFDISGSLPIAAGSSGLCGSGNAKWSGSYVTTSALYVNS